MSVYLPAKVRIASEVLFQKLNEESVLLDLKREIYYGLDDIGTRMWQLLTELEDVAAVLEHLLAEFDVDEETLRTDLAGLIAQLVEEGLLVTEPPQYQEAHGAGS